MADLGAVAQHKLVLLHICQAAPEQLNGGVVLGYHTLSLRDLFTQGSDVDLEVLALALKRQHLHSKHRCGKHCEGRIVPNHCW